VGASDASHPNRLMFTGREYDKETGLYYYRARYYNPQIGRFLQTDAVGYKAGMNWYAYCGNNSTNGIDPSGLIWEDASLRIILYDSSIKYWWEPFTSASSDPFWDVGIDIAGMSVDDIVHIFDGNNLTKIVENQKPKTFDSSDFTIEGLWIYGHGDTYGNNNGIVLPDSATFNAIFKSIGDGLNANHGEVDPIHLRQCTAPFGQSGDDAAFDLMQSAAEASGHDVTAPLGCLLIDPLAKIAELNAGAPGYAPWACSNGFGKVYQTWDSSGNVSWHRDYGYTGGAEMGQSYTSYENNGFIAWPVSYTIRASPTCVW
jgi:RHS repeat-associated protein